MTARKSATKRYLRARQRAWRRLAQLHPQEYAALLAEEKAAEKTAAETTEETPR